MTGEGNQQVVPAIVGGVKKGIVTAAATGIVSGIVAALIAVWGLVQQLPGTIGIVPKGAVVAFASEQGCPAGWTDYKEAWGRFIIGAVTQDKIGQIPGDFAEDARGEKLLAKDFGRPGGEEKHLLTVPEMPAHSHNIVLDRKWGDKSNQGVGWGSDDGTHPPAQQSTSIEGENQPHNILPPYVALYFCKKA